MQKPLSYERSKQPRPLSMSVDGEPGYNLWPGDLGSRARKLLVGTNFELRYTSAISERSKTPRDMAHFQVLYSSVIAGVLAILVSEGK